MERLALFVVIGLMSLSAFCNGKFTFQTHQTDGYLLPLVAKTIPVAENCGKIIQEVYQKSINNPHLKLKNTIGLFNKHEDRPRPDYQTDGDTTSQVYASNQLKDSVAGFIGEEDITDDRRPRALLNQINLKPISNNGALCLDSSDVCPEIPDNIKRWTKEDISLHVDALDATLEFVQGIQAMLEYLQGLSQLALIKRTSAFANEDELATKTQAREKKNADNLDKAQKLLFSISVLFGYVVEESPVAGVMYQPFYKWQGDTPIGRLVWGVVGFGYGGFTIGNLPGRVTIGITGSNAKKDLIDKIIDSLPDADVRPIGGTVKGLLVAIGEFHAWMDGSDNTKTWDTTGPAAVAMSAGGSFMDKEGNNVKVKSKVGQTTNYYRNNGVLMISAGVSAEDEKTLKAIAKTLTAKV